MLPREDAQLVQLTGAALADAARRSGPHLFCHPGCTPCCHGVFAISSLDAMRLQAGIDLLRQERPEAAAMLDARIAATRARLAADFPGNAATGHLGTDALSQERFDDFANDEPCPVLDPLTGTCDLYTHRPMTCRVFGPPVRSEDGLGVCELCYQTASTEEIAAAEMYLPDPSLEATLTETTGDWTTVIAFAFAPEAQAISRDTQEIAR